MNLSIIEGKSRGKESFLSCFRGDTDQPSLLFTWTHNRRMACFFRTVRVLSVLRLEIRERTDSSSAVLNGKQSS